MSRRNPWRLVRTVAASAGVIGGVLLVVGAVGFGIVALALEDPHMLWQVPALLLGFIGAGLALEWVCTRIARAWRSAENRWERERRD